MTGPPRPPFDPWAALLAWQQTWLASLDPPGVGRALREQRLARLIERACRGSPLYARRSGGAHRLQDFAPVGKAELMAGFDDWATDRRITLAGARAYLAGTQGGAGAWLGAYLPWTSSGTQGLPGIFVQDAASLAAYDAMEAQRLRGQRAGWFAPAAWGAGRRLAYVAALGPYAGHVSLERLAALVPPPLAPRITRISVLLPLAEIARRLQALQPDWLVTYPSCAMALAGRQAAGGLRLRLEELWLGGEHAGAAQMRQLREVFGCPVRSSYGASEAYSIACSCPLGQLHLNADWVILEPVDAARRPVPPGTLSDRVLLTNLANLVQPLLRYELTDRVRELELPCACGNPWPVIEVEGRSGDTVVLPGRAGGSVTLLPLALETVLEEEAGIADFQLLVDADGGLELRLPREAVSPAQARRGRDALLAFLERQGALPVPLRLRHAAPRVQPGSGKRRRVVVSARRPGARSRPGGS